MSGADSKTYQASFTDRLPDAKATISVGQEESLVSWETSDRVGIMYGTSNLEYKADQAGSRSSLSAVSASADATEVWKVLDEQKENVKTASTYLKTNNDLTDYSVAELEQQIAEAKSEDGWYTKAVKANEENEFIYLKDENDTAEKLANA